MYFMESKINIFNNKKILITGGGGYLGSKLAERIINTNAQIYLCDLNFNNLSLSLSKNYKNNKLVEINITEKEKIAEFCKIIKPDYIFHFAALLNRERDFSIYPLLYKVNVEGTLNLLEALKDIPYQGLCFSSSSEVYGSKNTPPFNEEQMPYPVSPYSLTKVIAENLIRTYSDIYKKPYTIIRLFNFYGPDMPENFFLSQLINTLKRNEIFKMTKGEQKRDYLYIDNLLDSIIAICKSEKCIGETINVCSGKGIELRELALDVAKILNKEHLLKIGALPYRNNEIWDMVGDNRKLIRLVPYIKIENKIKILNLF